MGKCSLTLDGKAFGSATWYESDAGYNIYCSCPFEEGFIYRVLLVLNDKSSYMLGVMIPMYGKFVLEKNLKKSIESILGMDFCNVLGAEIIRTLPGERFEGPLPFPLSAFEPFDKSKVSPEFLESFELLDGSNSLSYFHAGELYIASPLGDTEPFALSPVFCMATPIEINKKQFGIVKFDEKFNAKIVNIKGKIRTQ